jgi:hypothetical protein
MEEKRFGRGVIETSPELAAKVMRGRSFRAGCLNHTFMSELDV